jgi:hypothetical protein
MSTTNNNTLYPSQLAVQQVRIVFVYSIRTIDSERCTYDMMILYRNNNNKVIMEVVLEEIQKVM